jgi:hypothetical protein
VLLDKADIVEDLATGEISGTVWIDIELGEPTPLTKALGAAIEAKCRERAISDK